MCASVAGDTFGSNEDLSLHPLEPFKG